MSINRRLIFNFIKGIFSVVVISLSGISLGILLMLATSFLKPEANSKKSVKAGHYHHKLIDTADDMLATNTDELREESNNAAIVLGFLLLMSRSELAVFYSGIFRTANRNIWLKSLYKEHFYSKGFFYYRNIAVNSLS